MALGLSVALPYRGQSLLNPSTLFAGGEQGGWYDPSDLSTLFQDSAGTTPVTALGQAVGRINDKSGRGNHLTQTSATSRPTLEARVNLLTRTEEADNATWSKVSATITQNAATAPDGTLTADKLIATAVLGQHRVDQTPTSPAGAQVFSVYLKAAEYAFAFLRIGTTGGATVFDLSNGLAVGSGAGYTASIQAAGNGWFRCSISVTSAAANDIVRINALPTVVNTDYTGDGVSGILVWGAQLELGSTPTTYQRVTTATDYADIGAPRYLQFDGFDDFLTAPGGNFTAQTICFGALHSAFGNDHSILSDNDTAAFRGLQVARFSGGAVSLRAGNGTANTFYFGPTFFPGVSVPYVFLCGYDGANFGLQANGGALSPQAGGYSADTVAGFTVGANVPATDQRLNGRIYGLVFINRFLSQQERSLINRYMARQTGIAL